MSTVEIKPLAHGNLKFSVPTTLDMLDDEQPVPASHHCIRILSQRGDDRVVWDARSLAQIRDAKQLFDELVAKGMVPYRVDASGRQTPQIMDTFDAEAEEILFAPIRAARGG